VPGEALNSRASKTDHARCGINSDAANQRELPSQFLDRLARRPEAAAANRNNRQPGFRRKGLTEIKFRLQSAR